MIGSCGKMIEGRSATRLATRGGKGTLPSDRARVITISCVEVADLPGGRAVRDAKDPTGPVLSFTTVAWSAFTNSVRVGEFD
jgi:hypothetical protein